MINLDFVPNHIIIFWTSVIALLTVLVRVVFAFAVYSDALRLRRTVRPTILVNPAMWLFGTLMGGVFVAVAYWVLHHSTLNPFNTSVTKKIENDPIL